MLEGTREVWPVVAPWGLVGLPLWVVLLVLGREAAMTVFRQYAARRGVIISAMMVVSMRIRAAVPSRLTIACACSTFN